MYLATSGPTDRERLSIAICAVSCCELVAADSTLMGPRTMHASLLMPTRLHAAFSQLPMCLNFTNSLTAASNEAMLTQIEVLLHMT